MATWTDVRRLALALPEATECTSRGTLQWRVRDRSFISTGTPAVLVRLDEIDVAELAELVTEAWLDRAPKRLAKQYLDSAP